MRIAATRRNEPRFGFTLVELMVVIGIMAMLMSISVASFNSIYQSRGIDGAKNTIKGVLNTARMKAMRDKRDVTCSLSIDGALDVGFAIDHQHNMAQRIILLNRLPLPHERDFTDVPPEARKNWPNGEYQSDSTTGYWAFTVAGPAAGTRASRISTNRSYDLTFTTRMNPYPGTGSIVAVLRGEPGSPPIVEQYKISPDIANDTWETLPRFIEVDGRYFPITFRPDGTAALNYDHARIRLRDMRTDERWTWRLIVDRATGRASESKIGPSESDGEYER